MISAFFDRDTILTFNPPLSGGEGLKVIELLFDSKERENYVNYNYIRNIMIDTDDSIGYIRIYDNHITQFTLYSYGGETRDIDKLNDRLEWFEGNGYRMLDGYSVIPDVNQAFDKLYESEDDFEWAKNAVNEYDGLKGRPWHIDFDTDEDFIEIQKWLFAQGFSWAGKGTQVEEIKGIRSIQSVWRDNVNNQTMTRSDSWPYGNSLVTAKHEGAGTPIHIIWSDFIGRKNINENKMENPKSLLGLEFTLADENSAGSFIVYTIDSITEDFRGQPIVGISWINNGKTQSTTYDLQTVLSILERGIWKLYTGDIWNKLDD